MSGKALKGLGLSWGSAENWFGTLQFLSVGLFSNICFFLLLGVDTQQKALVLKLEVWGQLEGK